METRWFSSNGCVEYHGDVRRVYVGGKLIGSFGSKDRYIRNLILVGLCQEQSFKKGKLARAFDLTDEYLRRIRNRVDAEGIEAIPARGPGGSVPKLEEKECQRVYQMFEQGAGAKEAWRKVGRQGGVSYQSVWRLRKTWKAKHQSDEVTEQRQQELAIAAVTKDEPSEDIGCTVAEGSEEEEVDVAVAEVRGGRFVQHLGGWLLLGMLERSGLYEEALGQWGGNGGQDALRVSLDAVLLALSLGQQCVEGVRRLETPSAGVLLRASRAPSESWVRRVLKQYADEVGGAGLHLSMTAKYLKRARAEANGPAVFYVDNHMRPYTGKHTVRKGWRMQDKRVLPGATDYYVHDEDGRPVFRVGVPSNDSLTKWLTPITRFLRTGLGKDQRILVAFDRAGAYPEQLAALRNDRFEFVTYERRPYPVLSPSEFERTVKVDDQEIGVHESRTNLGRGRGRVRRIALEMPDGHQVNLLAVSEEPAVRLIEIMFGRWVQENGFKHGRERWGINQLDRRKVEHYAPETVIPNPARRRLDHALTLTRHREGDTRNKLARLAANDRRREKLERDLESALSHQMTLLALRPQTPTHAPLEETELAGRLVYHPGEYKTVLDTLRIACANAESDLACELAPHLRKPGEAKKALANLFAAPGDIRVNKKSITIVLSPVARKDERKSFEALLKTVNRWKLRLPADPKTRPLRFKSQL
jgi:transposase